MSHNPEGHIALLVDIQQQAQLFESFSSSRMVMQSASAEPCEPHQRNAPWTARW